MNRINFIRLLGLSSGFLLKLDSFAATAMPSQEVWSQHRRNFRPHDLAYYNLKGAVRTLLEIPLRVYRNMEVEQELMTTFNEQGYAVRHDMMQGNLKGYLEEWTVEEGTRFLERKSYYSLSQKVPHERLVFRYNPSGLVSEMSHYEDEALRSITYFKHDSNGWLIRQDEYNPQREKVYWRTLAYDKAGHMTQETENWIEVEMLNHSDVHQYDENGRLSKTIISNEDTRTLEYEYNDQGLVSMESLDGYPELFSYEYDSQGNWVERKSHRKGTLSSVEQRKITYY